MISMRTKSGEVSDAGQPGRTAGPGWLNTCLQYPLAVHKPRNAYLISLPELRRAGISTSARSVVLEHRQIDCWFQQTGPLAPKTKTPLKRAHWPAPPSDLN